MPALDPETDLAQYTHSPVPTTPRDGARARSAAKNFFGRPPTMSPFEQDMAEAVGAAHRVPYLQAEVPGQGRLRHQQRQHQ